MTAIFGRARAVKIEFETQGKEWVTAVGMREVDRSPLGNHEVSAEWSKQWKWKFTRHMKCPDNDGFEWMDGLTNSRLNQNLICNLWMPRCAWPRFKKLAAAIRRLLNKTSPVLQAPWNNWVIAVRIEGRSMANGWSWYDCRMIHIVAI